MQLFRRISQIVDQGGRVNTVTLIGAPAAHAAAVGQMMALLPDGTADGCLIDEKFTAAVVERIKTGAFGAPTVFAVDYGGDFTLFWDCWAGEANAVVFGGGHISVALADILRHVGFRVSVIDDRPEFAGKTRFPGADKVICKDFAAAIADGDVAVDDQTAVIIVTRGHRYDLDCLRGTIGSGAKYIGMIGSRSRVAGILSMLAEEGFSPDHLGRLRAPIGLDIGATTPAEIAVSIVAEIIAVFRGGSLRPLKLAAGEGQEWTKC
ncbi:XdhC family protein [Anaeroselena agilis]|uniref:XdhC family protein n=1 Tax=Anaeroselena agilis TaxID=3063788 RepID=A0ABU3P0N2_9FIRM|nr:XdhC family protein [Selenomonadales bacterium 4137-cl]